MQSAKLSVAEGDIVLAALIQSDGQYKLRPVLLLRQLPGYGDFLTCGLSSQLHQVVPDFGEVVQPDGDNGLRTTSVIRLEFLSLLTNNQIRGQLGKIPDTLHRLLLERLGNYLTIQTE